MGEICNLFLLSFCLPQIAKQIPMSIFWQIPLVADGKQETELVSDIGSPWTASTLRLGFHHQTLYFLLSECGFIKHGITIYNQNT